MLAPPRPRPKTIDRPRPSFYTLHGKPNDAFTIKLTEKTKISVVGFKTWDDAHCVGQMLEEHYHITKEWPNTDVTHGVLHLPTAKADVELSLLTIISWDFEDLKVYCTGNILDMISVDEIVSSNNVHSFSGNMYEFSAPVEFYQERFNQIWALEL